MSMASLTASRRRRNSAAVTSSQAHPAELDDEFEGWPPPTAAFFSAGGRAPSTVCFPLELQPRDYVHRSIDLVSGALLECYNRLVRQEEMPPCLGPQGEALALDAIHTLDLFRHASTPRAAAGLAEELRVPEPAIVGGISTLRRGMLLLAASAEPGWEHEGCKVEDVLAAARTLLSGAGVDQSYASNLSKLSKQHGQHERYSARRWAAKVDGTGASPQEKGLGSDSASKALRERRATIATGLRGRQAASSEEDVRSALLTIRGGAEALEAARDAGDDEAISARVARLSALGTKWCHHTSSLEGIEHCTKALAEAAEALALVLHETRKARAAEEEAWRLQNFSMAAEIRKRLDGDLKEAEMQASDRVKDAWARVSPSAEVDEGKKLVQALDRLRAEASTARDHEVSSKIETLRGTILANQGILAERQSQGIEGEALGRKMGQNQLLVIRAEEALAKEQALEDVRTRTSKGGEGEKELAMELLKVRQGLELLNKERVQGHETTTPHGSRPNSSKSTSSQISSANSNLLSQLSKALERMERRACAWGLVRRFESANEEQGLEMMREALERQVVSQGGGNDSRQICLRIEAERGIRGADVLKVLIDGQAIATDVEKYAKELADGRKDQLARWQGHKHTETSGGWLTRTVGTWGSEQEELRDPSGVAFGSNGRFLVADRSNHRVQVLGPSGISLVIFGEEDSEHSVQNPSGVAQGNDGQIIVTDRGGNRLLILGSMLQVKKAVGMQGNGPGKFQGPLGAAVSSEGSIFVADYGNHRIQEFDKEGEFVQAFGGVAVAGGESLFKYPSDVAYSESQGGIIAVADTGSHSVVLMQRDGRVLWRRGAFAGPAGVAFMPGGSKLVVSDSGNNRLQFLRVGDGELEDSVGSKGSSLGQLHNPRACDVNDEGVIQCSGRLRQPSRVFLREADIA